METLHVGLSGANIGLRRVGIVSLSQPSTENQTISVKKFGSMDYFDPFGGGFDQGGIGR